MEAINPQRRVAFFVDSCGVRGAFFEIKGHAVLEGLVLNEGVASSLDAFCDVKFAYVEEVDPGALQ